MAGGYLPEVIDHAPVDTSALQAALADHLPAPPARPRPTPLDADLSSLRRAVEHPTPAESAVSDALQTFESAVGGRPTLIAAFASGASILDEAQADSVDRLLAVLADPRAGGFTLGQLAKHAGITLSEVIRLYKDARIAYAHVEAIHLVAEKTPAVVADIMQQAIPHEKPCASCNGRGRFPGKPARESKRAAGGKHFPVPPPPPDELCERCFGTGKRNHVPDLETQKVALALAGLLQGPKSLVALTLNQTTNTQQNLVGGGASASAFSKMQAAADQILYGQKQPAAPPDLHVVPPTPPQSPSTSSPATPGA